MDVLSPILAILFVIGLLAGLLLLARRAALSKPTSLNSFRQRRLFSFPRRANPVSDEQCGLCVVKQASLTPSHRVHLLLVAGQNVLLCTHPQGCTVIMTNSRLTVRPATNDEHLPAEERSAG
jgi:hypothetical protein